jgi:hypothetical protein
MEETSRETSETIPEMPVDPAGSDGSGRQVRVGDTNVPWVMAVRRDAGITGCVW